MLGLSLPYSLGSPLLGYFTDKYPVSMKADVDNSFIVACWLFYCYVIILCSSGRQELVLGDRRYYHSDWLLSTWSSPFPSHSEVSTSVKLESNKDSVP